MTSIRRRAYGEVALSSRSRTGPDCYASGDYHLDFLAGKLRRFARHVVVLQGGGKAKERREALEQLAAIPEDEERLVLATGRYAGEGFDDARLDTLFLVMPIAWRGTLVQYAGRLHRLHPGKQEVVIYDWSVRHRDAEAPSALDGQPDRVRDPLVGLERVDSGPDVGPVEPVVQLDPKGGRDGYLGMAVHAKVPVWCLLDAPGEVVREGRIPTTAPALAALMRELSREGEVLAGQEVGTLTYLVHDAVTAAGTTLLSFNAQQLRMIAASRKKTDRRDAYWIAKALQSGMYPHPVYVPTGEIRELRALLSQRRVLHTDYNRWRHRARTYLRAGGYPVASGVTALRAVLTAGTAATRGAPPSLTDARALCQRQELALRAELAQMDAALHARTQAVEAIQRLMTVPGIGPLTATMVYAWVGDVQRFPHAKQLAAYAGLVPTVRQSGGTMQVGRITKQGAPALRATLVQAAPVLLSRCRGAEATPLQAIGLRIRGTRGRRKIAVVAVARHLLRIAYYILRDGTTYDAQRLEVMRPTA